MSRTRNESLMDGVALTLATGVDAKTAARRHGIGVSTLYRWRQLPEFNATIAAYRAEIRERRLAFAALLALPGPAAVAGAVAPAA